MAKKRKFRPRKPSNDRENKSQSDSGSNGVDDEVEEYHSNKDKELFNKSSLSKDFDSDDNEDESDDEIMALDDSSDSDDQQLDGLNRFAVQLKKDEMASDLEDSEEDLPDPNAWGNTKNMFYNTDYVDKDFRKYKQRDEDLAQYEEEEALAIQKRLLESISESDVGIDLLIGDIEPQIVSNDNLIDGDKDEDKQRLQTNLLNLTKRQKLDILRKESPELEALITEFKCNMNEIRDRLLPIVETIEKRKQLTDNMFAIKYIETRFHLLINYCINICFYMTLKSKRISVKDHPIIKQILSFKKLLNQLNSIEENNQNINKEVDLLSNKLKSGQQINFETTLTEKRKSIQNQKNLKKVKFVDNIEDKDLPETGEQLAKESEDMAKRGITYEMSKNKGLTPKRKKELKNPRVKHRMKYRKAKIRRKGQVREPRKEVNRYGGELSGIKSGVVKSVKFK